MSVCLSGLRPPGYEYHVSTAERQLSCIMNHLWLPVPGEEVGQNLADSKPYVRNLPSSSIRSRERVKTKKDTRAPSLCTHSIVISATPGQAGVLPRRYSTPQLRAVAVNIVIGAGIQYCQCRQSRLRQAKRLDLFRLRIREVFPGGGQTAHGSASTRIPTTGS